jgi:hypothetical protein
VKPRHLILIVAIGTSLIALAPSVEKAKDAAQDVKVMPAQEDSVEGQPKIVPASFDGETEKLAEH